MAPKNSEKSKTDRLRQALAHETAKIIVAEGVRDFHRAKIKASERLGNSQHGSLPSNFEIEQAINTFQKTFVPDYQQKLTSERRIALSIMLWLREHAPFLAGPVMEGTTGINSPISIHVSSDSVENIIDILQNKKIELKFAERRLNLNNEFVFLPTIDFEYEDHDIEVLVFSLRQQHQHPKSKSQNRSMQRINLKGLKELLTD